VCVCVCVCVCVRVCVCVCVCEVRACVWFSDQRVVFIGTQHTHALVNRRHDEHMLKHLRMCSSCLRLPDDITCVGGWVGGWVGGYVCGWEGVWMSHTMHGVGPKSSTPR